MTLGTNEVKVLVEKLADVLVVSEAIKKGNNYYS
jgi:hypothetical protein